VIAKQSREGWFPTRGTSGFRFGTNPGAPSFDVPPFLTQGVHILDGL